MCSQGWFCLPQRVFRPFYLHPPPRFCVIQQLIYSTCEYAVCAAVSSDKEKSVNCFPFFCLRPNDAPEKSTGSEYGEEGSETESDFVCAYGAYFSEGKRSVVFKACA